jgi:hypothetical protein
MANRLNAKIGTEIPADQGKEWIKRYQDKNPDAVKAIFYGSEILGKILAQQDCVGIRIYNAIGDDGIENFVLVGAKENGNNIWPSASDDSTPDGIVGDRGYPCPPACADNE